MADAGAIRAGRAYVELFADATKLEAGLNLASAKLKSWGESISSMGTALSAAGAAIVAPLAAGAGIFASFGTELAHASTNMGISVEELSALAYAAEQSGIAFEDLEQATKFMQKTIFGAGEGAEKSVKALQDIGLSVADLGNLSATDQFKRIADGIASIENPTARAGIAIEIFSRSGTKFLSFLTKGSDGISALTDEAQRMGFVMSGEDAESAVKLSQAFNQLWLSVKYVAVAIGAALAPAMVNTLRNKVEFVSGIKTWLQANGDLILSVFNVAKNITFLGIGIWGAGQAVTYLGIGLKTLSSVMGGVMGAMRLGAAAFMLFNTVMRMTMAAIWAGDGILGALVGLGNAVITTFFAMISPAGILLAIVAALAVGFLFFSDAGSRSIASFGEAWGMMKTDAATAFDGIVASIKAGDMEGAFGVLVAGLKALWTDLLLAFKTTWIEFKGWFMDGLGDIQTEIAVVLSKKESPVNALNNARSELFNFSGDWWKPPSMRGDTNNGMPTPEEARIRGANELEKDGNRAGRNQDLQNLRIDQANAAEELSNLAAQAAARLDAKTSGIGDGGSGGGIPGLGGRADSEGTFSGAGAALLGGAGGVWLEIQQAAEKQNQLLEQQIELEIQLIEAVENAGALG